MIPIFAQADIQNIPAAWLKIMITFMLVAIVIMAIIFGAIMSWLQYKQNQRPQTREITPQPLDVQLVEQFVTKNDFGDHVRNNDRDHAEFRLEQKKDRADNELHASARSKTLFDEVKSVREGLEHSLNTKHKENTLRLNELEKSVAGLDNTTELQNQSLAVMNSDIKTILREMPRKS